MKIGFDVIGDLHLSPDDKFDWENKATSLYCLVTGNISSDVRTVISTLAHLSKHYQGVFYSIGPLEYNSEGDIHARTEAISKACRRIRNVAVLHQHVVIIDGVAVLGCNGWFGDAPETHDIDEARFHQIEDLRYLVNSIEKLQKHLDVKKIMIVSGSVPDPGLYFGEAPKGIEKQIPLNITLDSDTQHKISHWVFGSHKKIVDITHNNINYLNNPYCKNTPYWARRIEVEV